MTIFAKRGFYKYNRAALNRHARLMGEHVLTRTYPSQLFIPFLDLHQDQESI